MLPGLLSVCCIDNLKFEWCSPLKIVTKRERERKTKRMSERERKREGGREIYIISARESERE